MRPTDPLAPDPPRPSCFWSLLDHKGTILFTHPPPSDDRLSPPSPALSLATLLEPALDTLPAFHLSPSEPTPALLSGAVPSSLQSTPVPLSGAGAGLAPTVTCPTVTPPTDARPTGLAGLASWPDSSLFSHLHPTDRGRTEAEIRQRLQSPFGGIFDGLVLPSRPFLSFPHHPHHPSNPTPALVDLVLSSPVPGLLLVFFHPSSLSSSSPSPSNDHCDACPRDVPAFDRAQADQLTTILRARLPTTHPPGPDPRPPDHVFLILSHLSSLPCPAPSILFSYPFRDPPPQTDKAIESDAQTLKQIDPTYDTRPYVELVRQVDLSPVHGTHTAPMARRNSCTERLQATHLLHVQGRQHTVASVLIPYGDILFACFRTLPESDSSAQEQQSEDEEEDDEDDGLDPLLQSMQTTLVSPPPIIPSLIEGEICPPLTSLLNGQSVRITGQDVQNVPSELRSVIGLPANLVPPVLQSLFHPADMASVARAPPDLPTTPSIPLESFLPLDPLSLLPVLEHDLVAGSDPLSLLPPSQAYPTDLSLPFDHSIPFFMPAVPAPAQPDNFPFVSHLNQATGIDLYTFQSNNAIIRRPKEEKRRRSIRPCTDGDCCESCGVKESVEWRRGADPVKRTLCNACGLRYARVVHRAQLSESENRKRKTPAHANESELVSPD